MYTTTEQDHNMETITNTVLAFISALADWLIWSPAYIQSVPGAAIGGSLVAFTVGASVIAGHRINRRRRARTAQRVEDEDRARRHQTGRGL